MKEKEKKDDIQSRREFFKKAAKKALPIVGAIVLASVPIEKADAQWGSGCNSCSGGCMGCSGGCTGDCGSSCGRGCSGGCTGTCQNSCSGTCSNMCTSSSII